MSTPLVLVSHSSHDKEEARELALLLVMDEIGVWFDEWEIPLGGSIVGGIDEALSQASHLILVWSAAASASQWVTEERRAAFSLAVDTGVPHIIVVRLDEEPLPALLHDKRFMTWRGGSEEDRAELVDAVLGRAPSSSFIRAVVRKYHEVIVDSDAEAGNPFPYVACPRCGGSSFNHSQAEDWAHDRVYYLIRCNECGWGEATE